MAVVDGGGGVLPDPVRGGGKTKRPLAVVRDVMTANVTTVEKGQTVADAIQVFMTYTFRHVLVTDGTKVIGVLSDRDITRSGARSDRAASIPVESVMSASPVVVTPETSLVNAVELIVFHRINCLPVVDDAGRLCGIVTTTDLLSALYDIMSAAGMVSKPGR